MELNYWVVINYFNNPKSHLGHEEHRTRPADILVPNWVLGLVISHHHICFVIRECEGRIRTGSWKAYAIQFKVTFFLKTV